MPVPTNWNQPSTIDEDVYIITKKQFHYLRFLTIVDAFITILIVLFVIVHFALEH
jgi:hypothetical protein